MRAVGIALLVILGLAALLATACGGFFTVTGLMEAGRAPMGGYSVAILVFSVPSLLIGVGVAVLCYRTLRKMTAPVEAPQGAQQDAPPEKHS
jgi:hypothetical protein